MEVLVVYIVIAALIVVVVVFAVAPNWLEMTILVIGILPRVGWHFFSGSYRKTPSYLLRLCVRDIGPTLKSLHPPHAGFSIGPYGPESPMNRLIWFEYDTEVDADAAIANRELIVTLVRDRMLARGFAADSAATLTVAFVAKPEIRAWGGGFHFAREASPKPNGRVRMPGAP